MSRRRRGETRRALVRRAIVWSLVVGIGLVTGTQAAATSGTAASERDADTAVDPAGSAGLEAIANELEGLPVHYEGRVMPFATAAELVVQRFSGRRSVAGLGAGAWFTALLVTPFEAVDDPVFLVDDPASLEAIGLAGTERRRVSYRELFPHLPALSMLATSLTASSRDLDPAEAGIVNLANNVRVFEGIGSTLDVFRAADGRSGYRTLVQTGSVAESELVVIPGMLRLVPLPDGEDGRDISWVAPPAAVRAAATSGDDDLLELLGSWATLVESDAVERDSSAALAAAAVGRATRASLAAAGANQTGARVRAEVVYRRLAPRRLAALAALALLPLALFARRWRGVQRALRVGTGALVLLLATHQVFRFIVTGRPPVTDLPSSFLFVAFVMGIVGFVQAMRHRDARTGAVLAAAPGLILLYLARLVTGAGDPFGVVQAVLDTNFWLTTHVVIVTSGYSAVLVAGVVAHVYAARRVLRPGDSGGHRALLASMTVAALAGLALTFLGTMLGGVWADQAWGRFWGWDPKENGALLIILWVAAILHARLARRVHDGAYAAAMIFGVNVVLFSWLGVNLMGVGLHSYGFSSASFWVLVGVAGVESLVAIGTIVAFRDAPRAPGMAVVRVVAVEEDGDAVRITLPLEAVPHRVGQYAGVCAAPRFGRVRTATPPRPFSFLDAPDGSTHLLVKPRGRTSTALATRVRRGDRLLVSEPTGDLAYRSQPGRDVVLAAGGVGIAPLVGLARLSLEAGNRTTLLIAGRNHVYQRDAVSALRERHPELRVVPALSDPPDGWDGMRGRLGPDRRTEPALLEAVSEGADWYICGSPEYCASVEALAHAAGAAAVATEAFTPIVADGVASPHRSRIAVNGRSVDVLPGETILDAAAAAGLPVRRGCMSGSCGRCACRVERGVARQSIEPVRAGPGDRIFTCVAYPERADGLELSTEPE